MFGPGLLSSLGEFNSRKAFDVLIRFEMKGEVHRKQRKMLSPVFSITHLREMGAFYILFSFLNLTVVQCQYSTQSFTRFLTSPNL